MRQIFRQILVIIPSLLPPVVAIASALLVGAGLMLVAGANPIAAYTALFQESLSTYFG
ncbi:MAG: ABC transporter permease, partial [Chroococcidiopsis sp.]